MDLRKFEHFKELVNTENVIFFFEGEFTQNIVAAIGDAVKQRLESDPAAQKKIRKIFSSFIEMTQNIAHYSVRASEINSHEGTSAVAVGKTGDKFFVVSGNYVSVEHVTRLREKLDPLRSMTIEEIKQAYKAQLKNDEQTIDKVSKGAGLGFLTVARDASEPIDYSIVQTTEYGGKVAYFFLRATI